MFKEIMIGHIANGMTEEETVNRVARLKTTKTCYYHENCPDGIAAAMIVAAAFKDLHRINFVPIQYGKFSMERLRPERGQIFVDITPPKERWEEWKGFDPLVLDHHVTVEEVTRGLDGVYKNNDAHSGARLAFEEIMLPMTRTWSTEDLIRDEESLVEWDTFSRQAMVYDTWKTKSDEWRMAKYQVAALKVMDTAKLLKDSRANSVDFREIQSFGQKMEEKHEDKVAKTVGDAFLGEMNTKEGKVKVAVMNTHGSVISDAGNTMINMGYELAVGFFFRVNSDPTTREEDFEAIVSLRSGGAISCSEVAKALGGGGHERAAGFRLKGAENVSVVSIIKTIEETLLKL